MFVDETTLVSVGVMLVVAGAVLLLPSVRRYCRDEPRPRGRLGFAVAVLFLAGFPKMALGVESWLPATEGISHGGVFVGGDEVRRVAFFVEEEQRRVCFSIVWIDGGMHSCRRMKRLLKYPFPFNHEGILADVVPEGVERVEVETSTGSHAAALVESDHVGVDVYYLLDAPSRTIKRIVGYDSAGHEMFRADG